MENVSTFTFAVITLVGSLGAANVGLKLSSGTSDNARLTGSLVSPFKGMLTPRFISFGFCKA